MINTVMFMRRFVKDFEAGTLPERTRALWAICKLYEECIDTAHDDRFYTEEDRRVLMAKTRIKVESLCKTYLEGEHKQGVEEDDRQKTKRW